MKLSSIVESISLEVKTGKNNLQNDVTGVYISDLLSDVMANSKEGNIWITLQTHLNIVAVAGLKNLSGIIIVGNRQIQQDVLQKAESENITVMSTPLPAFEVAGKLYQLLNG
ncbi:MAG TPA: serine kinase [Nitrospiraceae bacterium]|nr:serine kinase [Nitrospiraceae bacterium]